MVDSSSPVVYDAILLSLLEVTGEPVSAGVEGDADAVGARLPFNPCNFLSLALCLAGFVCLAKYQYSTIEKKLPARFLPSLGARLGLTIVHVLVGIVLVQFVAAYLNIMLT